MKPIIGITASENGKETHVKEPYITRIVEAGGVPIILPSIANEQIQFLLARIDGLLFTGGEDVDPFHFGAEPHHALGVVTPRRDHFEMALMKAALEKNKPILGICRGMQVLNIVLGGNMYQDIMAERTEKSLQHIQKAPASHASHLVHVTAGSLLKEIVKTDNIRVNSFHHQAVKDVPAPLIVSAASSDGIIEAIESSQHLFVIGVQWHPEDLTDDYSARLFTKFIEESSGGK